MIQLTSASTNSKHAWLDIFCSCAKLSFYRAADNYMYVSLFRVPGEPYGRRLLKTWWRKEKLLVTSIFYPRFCYPSDCKFHFISHFYLGI